MEHCDQNVYATESTPASHYRCHVCRSAPEDLICKLCGYSVCDDCSVQCDYCGDYFDYSCEFIHAQGCLQRIGLPAVPEPDEEATPNTFTAFLALKVDDACGDSDSTEFHYI
eukprot:4855494-Karenia_brevis.AAC.1